MTEVMTDILRKHFPNEEFPHNLAFTQLVLAVGLMEAGLSVSTQRHEGALEDLRALAQQMGMTEAGSQTDPAYQHVRFLFERTLSLEQTTIAGIPVPTSQAKLLLARGFESGESKFETFFSATILSQEQEGTWRFTTAILPSVRFMRDSLQPHEEPLSTELRPYFSGRLTKTKASFGVTIDQNTSSNAIGALRLQMRTRDLSRRPPAAFRPDSLSDKTVVHEWLQHFIVDTPQGESKYYAHFPRPSEPLLSFR